MVIVIIFVAVAFIVFSDITVRLKTLAGKKNAAEIALRYLFIYMRTEVHAERDEAEAFAFLAYKRGKKIKKITGLKSLYRLYKKYKRLPLIEQESLNRAISYMLSKARIVLKKLSVKIGTGDAFATSIVASTVMIVLNGVFAKTGRFKAAGKSDTKVLPVFDKEHFEVDLNCIIHIKPVHIIIGYFKFLLKRR